MSDSFGLEADNEVFLGFVDEAIEAIDEISPSIITLEENPFDIEVINKIFRVMHSLKGNAPFFGLLHVKHLAHELENLLAAMRDKVVCATPDIVSHLLKGTDELRAMILRVKDSQSEILNQSNFDLLIQTSKDLLSTKKGTPDTSWNEVFTLLQEITERTPTESDRCKNLLQILMSISGKNTIETVQEASKKPASDEAAPVTKSSTPQTKDNAKTMRVPEERIDTFLSFVGELIIGGETLRHLMARLDASNVPSDIIKDFHALNESFTETFGGLESAIMSIRKVSIKGLLNKVPRIIRDVASAKGKQVDIVINGEEHEVDKSLLELLDAPLVHMARNAADHGIELPEIRKSAGKSPKGVVHISCKEQDKFFIIEVSDDGGGLNYVGLKNKALSMGLISHGQELSEQDVINLIFAPGISTASEVSDISGRGVGMDVVRQSIESAGGKIGVISSPGQGSTFTLQVPKSITTQIIEGLIISIGGISCVLPLESVSENWVAKKSDVHFSPQEGFFIERYGKILKFFPLSERLQTPLLEQSDDEFDMITVQYHGVWYAFAIDKVIGHRQLVLKELDHISNQASLFSGAALLGDGNIAFMLNLDSILTRDGVREAGCSSSSLAH